VAGCPRALRVAFLRPLSRPFALWGTNARNGMRMAVEELNAAGGTLGRPVELVKRDDRNNPAEAIRKGRFVQPGGDLPVGCVRDAAGSRSPSSGSRAWTCTCRRSDPQRSAAGGLPPPLGVFVGGVAQPVGHLPAGGHDGPAQLVLLPVEPVGGYR